MPAIGFTSQQLAALESRGNVAVSAGAGSGKTRVLVEKYFRILADEKPKWAVGAVVAITFTVKAASELRARIVQRIRQELDDPELPAARRARLLEIRRELPLAPIGTIHNFCSRILREHAFDAHISPDFLIVEGIQESNLRKEAALAALSDAASQSGSRAFYELLILQTLYTRTALMDMLTTLLQRRAEFLPAATRFATSSASLLYEDLQKFHEQVVTARRATAFLALAEALEKFCGCMGGVAQSEAQAIAAELRAARPGSAAHWDAVIRAAQQVQEKGRLFTQKGEFLKKLADECGVTQDSPAATSLYDAAAAVLSRSLGSLGMADRENLAISVMLSSLFLRAVGRYTEARKPAGLQATPDMLDFADLEIVAAKLLRDRPEIRESLRKSYHYLIVDEFQDTSELQWQILGCLACDEGGVLEPSRFFMVGDPKQGVYGFRQASAHLFQSVSEQVELSNKRSESGTSGRVSMTANFRTLEGPLHLINQLFAQIIKHDPEARQVEFEPLAPQREGTGYAEVRILPKTDDPAQAGEPEMVAQLVEEIVASYNERGELHKPGDVAILFRKRKHFEVYAQALRERNVPVIIHQGTGLYDQPEIKAVLAWLKLVNQPSDDLAVAEVLRGPSVNFSDDLLFKLSLVSGTGFWNKVCRAEGGAVPAFGGHRAALSPVEAERVSYVVDLYRFAAGLSGFETIDGLLLAIIERTGIEGVFAAGDSGMQAHANLRKLVELARRLNTRSVAEYLDFVDSGGAGSRSEGAATAEDEAESGVQIMTIHAAKGLEFPVVILPELADPISARPGNIQTDGSDWIAGNKSLSVNDQSDTLFLPSWLAEQQLLRSAAEERRVLYVAMTRCQDELYLTATRADTAPANSFFGWIEPLLPELPINTRVISAHSLETAGAVEDRLNGGQPHNEEEVHVRRFYDHLKHGMSLADIREATSALSTNDSVEQSAILAESTALTQTDFLDISQAAVGTSDEADESERPPGISYFEGRAILGALLEASRLIVSGDEAARLTEKLWLMPEQLRFMQWALERLRERGSLAPDVARFFEEGSLPGTELISRMPSGTAAATPDREVRLDNERSALFLAWGTDSVLAAQTGARVWLKTMVESGLTSEAFVYDMHDGSLRSVTPQTDGVIDDAVPDDLRKWGSSVLPASFARDQIRGLLGSTKAAS